MKINASLYLSLLLSFSVVDGEEVDFPPLLDADDIAYFSENHDIDGLHWALSNVFHRSKRNTNSSQIKFANLPKKIPIGATIAIKSRILNVSTLFRLLKKYVVNIIPTKAPWKDMPPFQIINIS